MERSYKSNIIKIYFFSFILGIHTVRGVYIPFMMDWGGLSFFQIMILQSYFDGDTYEDMICDKCIMDPEKSKLLMLKISESDEVDLTQHGKDFCSK